MMYVYTDMPAGVTTSTAYVLLSLQMLLRIYIVPTPGSKVCCAKPGTILAVAHTDTNHCQPLHTTNNRMKRKEQDQKVAKLTLRLCRVESCDFVNF